MFLDVIDEENAEEDRENSSGGDGKEVDLDIEEAQSESSDESGWYVRHAINQTEQPETLGLQLWLVLPPRLAYQVNVPSLTHPQQSRRQSAYPSA